MINATELRLVNFSMETLDPPLVRPRSSARVASMAKVPKPKKYRMPTEIDDEIHKSCW